MFKIGGGKLAKCKQEVARICMTYFSVNQHLNKNAGQSPKSQPAQSPKEM